MRKSRFSKAQIVSILKEVDAGMKMSDGCHANAVLRGPTRTGGVGKFVQDLFPDVSPEEAERRFMREKHSTSLKIHKGLMEEVSADMKKHLIKENL